MLTLTNAADLTKKLFIIGVFVIILIGFVYVIITSVKKSINSLKPPPPPVLTTTFDKLPGIVFPNQNFPTDIRFTLETLSGNIPSASTTAKIYFLPKKQKSLLTNVRANQDAKNLGIESSATVVNKQLVYTANSKEFTIDPISRNFTYSYNYNNEPTVFSGKTLLTKGSATSVANNFLKTLDALPADFNQNPNVTFLTYNGAQFIPIGENEDPAVATAARVDYFRNKVDSLPVVNSEFDKGNISVIVSKSDDKNKQVIRAIKSYQEISNENIGIYPVKSGDLAWQDFINGIGYIADSGNSTFTKRVVIRDAYLAYFDDGVNISYLMPVYVFIGDDGFIAYVSAVSDQWISP
ncbi:hypothetical protein HYT02_04490 [Candidatus Gottesmanbacteria bacterium]|nr:hypothetical protein [Candidatus Gottesmanbacteria bacterium]